jgi:hypothetical protein
VALDADLEDSEGRLVQCIHVIMCPNRRLKDQKELNRSVQVTFRSSLLSVACFSLAILRMVTYVSKIVN